MDATTLLLNSLQLSLHPHTGEPLPDFEPGLISEVLELAEKQSVLPLILRALQTKDAYLTLPGEFRNNLTRKSRMIQVQQLQRTIALNALLSKILAQGLHPAVMKGIACRSTYPVANERVSCDEDIIIPEEEFTACCNELLECGYRPVSDSDDAAFEVTFASDDLVIELHKAPFNPDSAAMSRFNRYFTPLRECTMQLETEDFTGPVLDAQRQLLLLILHAFKHFVHSGMGIRQVCDCIMWAENYGCEIDYAACFRSLESVSAAKFGLCIFRIGEEFLGFDTCKAKYPEELLAMDVPYREVLADFLSGSVFGADTASRAHSATVTLNAYEGHENGTKSSILQSIFPPLSYMEKEYPYLKEAPAKLPLAWANRIIRYIQETRTADVSASEAAKIGNDRKRLLRSLDIVD